MMSMRGNNIHFSRATVHHELIPGHHLQGYMTLALQDVPPPVQHAILGRRLGSLLGAAPLGQRDSPSRPKIASACCSGGCIAVRESFSH